MAEGLKTELAASIPDLRAFARTLSGSVSIADDLVQDTLLKAWAARDNYEQGTNLKAWLFTILRNHFYSEMRKSGREVEDPDGIIVGSQTTPAEQDGKMLLQELRYALAVLPKEQMEALILIGASGFSHEEAAEIMGCAVGTVKSRVSRARTTLMELIDSGKFNINGFEGDANSALEHFFNEGQKLESALLAARNGGKQNS